MHILDTALPRGRITQVTHVKLPRETAGDPLEHFSDGIFPLRPLTEHIFFTDWGIEVDTTHSGTLLAAVVLLFHHQIEFFQCIPVRAVFTCVIRDRLQQADHRHSTLMLELFHIRCKP